MYSELVQTGTYRPGYVPKTMISYNRSSVNGCPRHREVSAAHSQRHVSGLVAGLVLGFAARRRRPEVGSEKMRKHVQVRIMNQQK